MFMEMRTGECDVILAMTGRFGLLSVPEKESIGIAGRKLYDEHFGRVGRNVREQALVDLHIRIALEEGLFTDLYAYCHDISNEFD